jgi:hypothetical protein
MISCREEARRGGGEERCDQRGDLGRSCGGAREPLSVDLFAPRADDLPPLLAAVRVARDVLDVDEGIVPRGADVGEETARGRDVQQIGHVLGLMKDARRNRMVVESATLDDTARRHEEVAHTGAPHEVP